MVLVGTLCSQSAYGQAVAEPGLQVAARTTPPDGIELALVLRPEPALRELAHRVAKVLALRSQRSVAVGEEPPPGLLEAVPRGHVALAERTSRIVLVAGSEGGISLETVVPFDADGSVDTRAVALAVEVLGDSAADEVAALARRRAEAALAAPSAAGTTAAKASQRSTRTLRVRLPPPITDVAPYRSPAFLDDIAPYAFVRSYAGASSSSGSLEAGLAAGAGLCAARQCLIAISEIPVTSASTEDLRYRYVTFSAVFYSRPVTLGDFTPAISLGFLSRIGRFGADMGLPDEGLDTDLGARGALELAYTPLNHLDLVVEGGVDLALDRLRRGSGDVSIPRGQRLSPWLQFSVRLRTHGH